jgi:hypothetical protein
VTGWYGNIESDEDNGHQYTDEDVEEGGDGPGSYQEIWDKTCIYVRVEHVVEDD